jgi:hypothetical protein
VVSASAEEVRDFDQLFADFNCTIEIAGNHRLRPRPALFVKNGTTRNFSESATRSAAKAEFD